METTSKPDGALDLLGKAASAVSASSKTAPPASNAKPFELSQPVPFLQDKLQQVKAVYTSIPPGLDLSDAKQLQQTFPNVSTGRRPIPLCLLLDAPTASDQLTVINYWQGLSKQKQATAMEQLKHYYSNPMASNVRLNPNYIELYQLTKGFTTSLNHWTPSQAPPLPDTSKKRPPPSEQPEEEEDDDDTLPKFPLVPPLSQPIPCLGNKLQSVRAVYQELPPHVDWNNPKQLQQLFPCYNGGSRQIPLCLLLEAATDQDKLSVLNYWAGLSAAQQKEAVQALKDHFANPTVSNAPLPADYLYKKRVTKNFTIPFKKCVLVVVLLLALFFACLSEYYFLTHFLQSQGHARNLTRPPTRSIARLPLQGQEEWSRQTQTIGSNAVSRLAIDGQTRRALSTMSVLSRSRIAIGHVQHDTAHGVEHSSVPVVVRVARSIEILQ